MTLAASRAQCLTMMASSQTMAGVQRQPASLADARALLCNTSVDISYAAMIISAGECSIPSVSHIAAAFLSAENIVKAEVLEVIATIKEHVAVMDGRKVARVTTITVLIMAQLRRAM